MKSVKNRLGKLRKARKVGKVRTSKRGGVGERPVKKTLPDGTYEGFFDGDKRNGKGIMRYSNGDAYQGDWVDDKKQGQGEMAFSVGGGYSGTWFDNKKQGDGTMYYSDGSRYKGNWVEDEIQGRGDMMSHDGSTYIGDWDDGKRNGEGVLYGPNREVVYRGHWLNDEQDPDHVPEDETDDEPDIDVNQIHKFVGNIDTEKLNTFLKDHSGAYSSQWATDQFAMSIFFAMKTLMNNESAKGGKATQRAKNFKSLWDNILNDPKNLGLYKSLSPKLLTAIFLSLKYAQLQTPVFKDAYVESYLDDTCKAHGDTVSVDNFSCPAGSVERFITSLSPAATAALSTNDATKEEEYKELIEMISKNPKIQIPDLVLDWIKLHPQGKDLENMDTEQRKANLIAFIKTTVKDDSKEVTDFMNEYIDKHVKFENDDFAYGGGKKTRKRRRKNKKMAKTKKRKLKKRKSNK